MPNEPLVLIEHENGEFELAPRDSPRAQAVDPRSLIDVCALVERLQQCALGQVQMFDPQLAAAKMLLERVLPTTQSVKVETTINKVNWDSRLGEMAENLVKLLERKRNQVIDAEVE